MTFPVPRPGLRLTAGVSLWAVAAACAAQSNPAGSTLDTVVVTGSRIPVPRDRVVSDVVVIDAERIRASTADSVEDLLRREAGLGLSRTGGPGQTAGLFIRGATTSSTVVLVDGVRIGSATSGGTEFEGISLAQIERIEVLRGPASSLYGADAVGGVIQIFTRRGGVGTQVDGRVSVGSYGSSAAELSASGRSGAFDLAASVSHERSDGTTAQRPSNPNGSYNPDGDGYSRTAASARLGYTPAAGHRIGLSVKDSRLESQYDSAVYPPPNYTPDPSPDFRSRLHLQTVAADYSGVVSSFWTTGVTLASSDDDAHSAIGIASSESHFRTRRDQYTFQNTFTFAPQQQALVLLERIEERAQSTSYAADVKRTNDAVMLGYSGSFGAHLVQADVRRDDNSVYGANTTGRLGWSLQLAPQWRVRALAGTSFRAPSFNDLVYPGYGVITLQPERGRSVELGVNWHAGDSRASATVYRNRVSALIDYQSNTKLCPAGYTYGCASNIKRARLQGVSLDASQHVGAWQFGGAFDYLSALDADTGARLVRRVPRQLSANAAYTVGSWTVGADALALSRRPDVGGTLGGYATLDLKAVWRVAPAWQLEAKVQNAADRDVQPVLGYQGLGRQVWLTARYSGQGF